MTDNTRPARKPARPFFSSGPTAKFPGWSLDKLKTESLGRSHRSAVGKSRLKYAIDLSRELLGVPEETAMLVEHMLLAHHGQAEFGSPKLPMFPEAEVLAEIDLLDSKMFEMFDALSGVSVGAFSERQWALDNRQIYCHGHGHLKKGESK